MASPFSIFRKNQKVMMAALVLLAMFGFVILPNLMEVMGGRAQKDPVVATTKTFGSIKRSDLENLRISRMRVLDILSRLSAMGETQMAVASGQMTREAAVAMQDNFAQYARQNLEQYFGPATLDGAANLWLLSSQANQLGMVVSDDMIREFIIKYITKNAVSSADILAVLRSAGYSERTFCAMLREELLALQLTQDFQVSMLATTPGQRWDYFNRVKRTAAIEALPVAVADFVKDVQDPKDSVVRTFFDANRQRRPNPVSPEPGFRQPHEVALEYVLADTDKFAKDVTDAEIQAFYEKNKAFYDQFIERDAENEKASAEKKVPPLLPREGTKEKASKTDTKPVERTAKKPVQESEKQPEKTAEKKAEKKDADGLSPSPLLKKAETKTVLSKTMKERIRRAVAQEKILKVFEKLRKPMDQYAQKWNEYVVERIKSEDKSGNALKQIPPPEKLDLAQLAKANGLTAGSTKLMAQWEAETQPIGKSLLERRLPVWRYAYKGLSQYRPMVSEDADNLYLFWMTDEVKDHVPKFTDPGVREKVIHAWKMVQARKLAMKHAKSLADEAAKAKKSLKQTFANRPNMLVVMPPKFSWMTFGSVASFESMPVPRLSEVTGVPMAGEEFMRTVFELEKPGQLAVAFNAPQTVAYVVQLNEFSPVFESRMSQFEVDNFSKYAAVAMLDQARINDAWIEEIKRSSDFQWTPGNKPEQLENAEQPVEQE